MNKIFKISIFLAFTFLLSCTKQEGEGGTASIKGKVIVNLCSDDFSKIYATFPDEKRDVYIVYGDNDYFDDKAETSYDGSFKFDYLRKGKYQVFAYSDDESGLSASGKVPVIVDINIDKNGENVEVPTIEVYNQVSNYEGSSSIQGKLFAYDWNSELTILKDSFYLKNEYVYIARRGDLYYFDRIRTFYDGSFVFPSLPMGEYEVFAFGRDFSQQDPQDEVATIIVTSITANKQVQDIGRLDVIR